MGLKNQLTIIEQNTIDVLHQENFSSREIAARLANGRSHTTVNYYLNHPKINRKTRLGQKRKLSASDDRLIGRLASNEMISSRKIRSELNLNVSPVTIRRSLKIGGHMVYSKKRKTLKISTPNK